MTSNKQRGVLPQKLQSYQNGSTTPIVVATHQLRNTGLRFLFVLLLLLFLLSLLLLLFPSPSTPLL